MTTTTSTATTSTATTSTATTSPATTSPATNSKNRYFEDFEEGEVIRHAMGRTITDADNMWFTHVTVNTNQIHFNATVGQTSEFGAMLVNSCFTIALVTGLTVPDISQNAVANLGWDEVRLPAPVYVGDTIWAESIVLEARPSSSRPAAGIVRVGTRGLNQRGETVISFKRTAMIHRRDAGIRSVEIPVAPVDIRTVFGITPGASR